MEESREQGLLGVVWPKLAGQAFHPALPQIPRWVLMGLQGFTCSHPSCYKT